jgi:hypothetical protein
MDWHHIEELMDASKEIYSELKNICVWNKSNAGMGSALPVPNASRIESPCHGPVIVKHVVCRVVTPDLNDSDHQLAAVRR